MKPIVIPDPINLALQSGATLAISISGGKDSQAMLYAIMEARTANWTDNIFAIHADLGRMEWPQSLPFCRAICAQVDIPLVVVNRPQGDLLQEMQDRMVKLAGTGKPHFPSAANRYCTADQKRSQIDKELRHFDVVISAEGVRADESPARSKRAACESREQICTRTRTAYNWRPLLHWTVEDVWERIGTSSADVARRQSLYRAGQVDEAFDGWPGHPAYVMGNQRVSCAMCVLASRNDITNGARHNPELYRELVAMEEESGFAFRQDLRLGDLEL